MSDAQKLWDWSGLRVEEFVAAVNAPNKYYIGRCKVIVPPFIIHEVVLLQTVDGVRVAMPGRPFLVGGKVALTDDGRLRRITMLSMLNADDWTGFTDAVVAAVEAEWGPLRKIKPMLRKIKPMVRVAAAAEAAEAVGEDEGADIELPAQYRPA
jgi:hypothetical protein